MSDCTEAVKSVSVTNLVNQREAIVSRLNQAIGLIGEARVIAAQARLGMPRIEMVPCSQRGSVSLSDTDEARKRIQTVVDAGGWGLLMSESGLRTFMDAKARAEWDSNLYEGKNVPELTIENVRATFQVLNEARGDMFDRGVLETFRRLSWEYKTNSPRLFGKRIIVNHLARYCGRYLSFVTSTCNELDDLARVFTVLDGKPEPDHRTGYWHRLEQAARASAPMIEDDYCTLRWYKRGTGHLTFKRPDLVQKLNDILAKHHPNALPAA